MFNRRDITSIAFYGLLFALVVIWAELRPTNPKLLDPREPARASMGARQIDLVDDQPEIRRLAKHLRVP